MGLKVLMRETIFSIETYSYSKYIVNENSEKL
jgi:hypothetical protein